ncbi:DNA-binding transcriptional regulator [Reticulibacter mediterranei]|uniref:DNA-binding transcriptional regulator n=1 Tax=Reticulibacter mediterranei TaxID=2778369 RepID=A0A8J3IRD3_9CHLR|nr:sugar-binding domain-containing protein [Reticulibacter mediterranei]GHP00605.1 DNA-binding transcriptional regulator [Reticulibacter mediterranei]
MSDIIEGNLLTSEQFLRKVAILYYDKGKTQESIASLLYCSRQTISKALQKAEDRGIVRISVIPEERAGYVSNLAHELRFHLELEELILVPGRCFDDSKPDSDLNEEVLGEITEAAAHYLDQVITHHDILAVTGGRSIMRNVVRHLKPSKSLPDLQVVPTIGFVEQQASIGDANLVAYDIAKLYGGKDYWLPIPALVETQAQQEQARNLPLVRDVFKMIEQANIIMMGLWPSDLDHDMVKRGVLSEQQVQTLQGYHPVADINHWVFDAEGRSLNNMFHSFPYYLTGLEIPRLPERITHQHAKVILVAGASTSRIPAIRAALRAGLANVLITDHITAQRLK